MKKYKSILFTLALAFSLGACTEEYLNTSSSNKVSDDTAFSSIESAQNILIGAYDWFTNGWLANYTNQYLFFMPDVMGDDALVSPVGNYNRFVAAYQYSTTPTNTYVVDPWRNFYSLIDNCNALLDHIESLPANTERDRIEGEALGLRVYAYHYLVRMYAKPVNQNPETPGVVLRLHSNDEPLPRATVKAVYEQLVGDIEKACTLLGKASGTNKFYMTLRAAHAIAARLYLDLGDETKGISHAKAALDGITLMSKDVYESQFCELNSETIWAFTCTSDDNQFYLSLPSFWYLCDDNNTNRIQGYSSLRVSKNLIDLFEDKDVRKGQFPYDSKKNDYISSNGYLTTKIHSRDGNMGQGDFNMIRGSEMYLIIAELAADKQHYNVAREALNTVRTARGASEFTGADTELANAVQLERRLELFAEGHRFFDLKRRHLPLKRSGVEGHLLWGEQLDLPAGSDRFELAIPQMEIDANDGVSDSDQNPYYKSK